MYGRAMKRCLVVLASVACGSAQEAHSPTTTRAPSPPPASGSAGTEGSAASTALTPNGLDLDGMDRNVKPGDDFYRFANGGWLANTEIPSDRASYSTSAIRTEVTTKRVADLIQEAAKAAPAGSEARKVGDFYATYMDEAAIEAKGLAPLQPTLDRIAAIKDAKSLAHALGRTLRADVDAFNNTDLETGNIFGLWVAQDLDTPTSYAAFLLQGGLGMPDRDYYLDPAPQMAEYRDKYQAYIANLLALAKLPDHAAQAKRIVELETRIAASHATSGDSGNIRAGNNHWTRADFRKRAPGLDWTSFFDAAGLGTQQVFVVWQPTAATGIAAAVKATPLATWKAYLAFHAIERASAFLPKAFVDEVFAFYGTTLSGTPTIRDRWKRGVSYTGQALGEAVGKLYVTRYFPESEKQRATEMVRQVVAAFGRRIDQLSWMSPTTKAKAKAKLAVLKIGVGYPDTWRDYSALQIVSGDALGNAERAALFEYHRNLAKLGKPVNRSEWMMYPHVVNATNLPAMNAINFPAAILQPPNFDPNRPIAMDYGAFGATIGHEISHSFDDQGALFDETGKLENWWAKDDLAHFQAAAAQLVKQYDAYRPFPDLAINGTHTLSENIADVAGLAAAYDAYRSSRGGAPMPTVNGLTDDQQFFVSFAQGKRAKFREPALRHMVRAQSHSPGEYRAATVRNLDAWYAAFGIAIGDKLYLEPVDRVRIW